MDPETVDGLEPTQRWCWHLNLSLRSRHSTFRGRKSSGRREKGGEHSPLETHADPTSWSPGPLPVVVQGLESGKISGLESLFPHLAAKSKLQNLHL